MWNGGNTFTITSTEVNPAHRGNGYAKTLVLKAAEIAKERQAKVIPQCSYARAVFERAPDLRALIAK
ncbi:MAG: N-acetyltransferase [Kiritimatiellae bacterium]|nr:N-acetyltransferase [Kiritimatiellia bacterium]